MAKYRKALPQLTESTFLTDGGLETTLIFNQGIFLWLNITKGGMWHLLNVANSWSAGHDPLCYCCRESIMDSCP